MVKRNELINRPIREAESDFRRYLLEKFPGLDASQSAHLPIEKICGAILAVARCSVEQIVIATLGEKPPILREEKLLNELSLITGRGWTQGLGVNHKSYRRSNRAGQVSAGFTKDLIITNDMLDALDILSNMVRRKNIPLIEKQPKQKKAKPVFSDEEIEKRFQERRNSQLGKKNSRFTGHAEPEEVFDDQDQKLKKAFCRGLGVDPEQFVSGFVGLFKAACEQANYAFSRRNADALLGLSDEPLSVIVLESMQSVDSIKGNVEALGDSIDHFAFVAMRGTGKNYISAWQAEATQNEEIAFLIGNALRDRVNLASDAGLPGPNRGR